MIGDMKTDQVTAPLCNGWPIFVVIAAFSGAKPAFMILTPGGDYGGFSDSPRPHGIAMVETRWD